MNTPKIEKKEADKKDFLVVRNKRTLDVVKVVAPHEFQVGVDEQQQANICLKGNQSISGELVIKNGCLGALKLPKNAGLAIKEGAGIKIVDNRNDTIDISIDPAYLDTQGLKIEPLPNGGILTSSIGNKLLLSIDQSFVPSLPTFVAGDGISILTESNGVVEIGLSNQRGTTSQTGTELVMNADLSGVRNGINKIFALNDAPVRDSFMMWLNGQLLTADSDYELDGSTVTILGPQAPTEDDIMKALYSKNVSSKFYAINIQPQSIIINNDNTASIELQHSPVPESSLMIFLNGQLLTQGNAYDYTLSEKNVFISKKVIDDDIFRVTYSYSGQ